MAGSKAWRSDCRQGGRSVLVSRSWSFRRVERVGNKTAYTVGTFERFWNSHKYCLVVLNDLYAGYSPSEAHAGGRRSMFHR